MSGYSEHYRDMQHAAFLEKWVPREEKLPEATPENLRFNIARARAAEAELNEIKRALHVLKRAIKL